MITYEFQYATVLSGMSAGTQATWNDQQIETRAIAERPVGQNPQTMSATDWLLLLCNQDCPAISSEMRRHSKDFEWPDEIEFLYLGEYKYSYCLHFHQPYRFRLELVVGVEPV